MPPKANAPAPAPFPLVLPSKAKAKPADSETPLLPKKAREKFLQLMGARTLVTMWIVLGHFMGEPRGAMEAFFARGDVAVAFYIVLSGFMTQTAYSSKSCTSCGSITSYYAGRFGRTLLTYYFMCAAGWLQRGKSGELMRIEEYLLPLLLADAWKPEDRLSQPYHNLVPSGWIISTLALPWLIYPFLNLIFKCVHSTRGRKLICFYLLLAFLAVLPTFAAMVYRQITGPFPEGQLISPTMTLYLLQFPPLRLVEFILGMAAAEIARHPNLSHWWWWPVFGAASLACIVCCAFFLPYDPQQGHVDSEAIWITAFSPLWGLLLIGLTVPSTSDPLRRLLSHPAFSAVGGYSFAVYLFQWFWFFVFQRAQGCVLPGGLSAVSLLGFIIVLWTSAGVWSELVEAPLMRAIKSCSCATALKVFVLGYGIAGGIVFGVLELSPGPPPREPCAINLNTSNWPSGALTTEATLTQLVLQSAKVGVAMCDPWDPVRSVEALELELGGRFTEASTSNSSISLQGGRWADAPTGGVMSDSAGALASVRVQGASSVTFAVHATCGRALRAASPAGEAHRPSERGVSCAEAAELQELLDVLVDNRYVGSFELARTCPRLGRSRAPMEHSAVTVDGMDPRRAHRVHLVRRLDATRGGVTLRGVLLPLGGTIRPTLARAAPRGALLSIGRSRAAGTGVLCTNWPQASPLSCARASHPHYSLHSMLAHQLGLSFSAVAVSSPRDDEPTNLVNWMSSIETRADVAECLTHFPMLTGAECGHDWYLRTLYNDGALRRFMNFSSLEDNTPTRVIMLGEVGDQPSDAKLFATFLTMLLKLHPYAVIIHDGSSHSTRAHRSTLMSTALNYTCTDMPSDCARIRIPAEEALSNRTLDDGRLTAEAMARLGEGCNGNPSADENARLVGQMLPLLSRELQQAGFPKTGFDMTCREGSDMDCHSPVLYGAIGAPSRSASAKTGVTSTNVWARDLDWARISWI
ncbi:hypothetical protein AB1Y20_005566 [Prymnesium parvum]|uniref:Acyltransferase 3 domain-containing protein n=1 Tax=Prymnesium parvum TaxID=97485 RepID=A0AB34J4I8_PRYPA